MDISERKRAEEELRRKEEEFKALVTNSPDLIARYNLEGQLVYVNPAFERLAQMPRDQILGRTYRELGVPEHLCQSWEEELRRAIKLGEEISFDFDVDGLFGLRHFNGRFVPEFDAQGKVVSLLGVGVDITDRKNLQSELMTVVEHEQRRIGQDLHDDVGQELTGVGLMADALAHALEKQGLPEAERVAKIRSHLDNIQDRVRSLSQGLIPVEVDAQGLVAALKSLTDRMNSLDGIQFSFTCDRSVGIADNRVATYLYRIAQEAIANATRHAEAGQIDVTLTQDPESITLDIQDDGIGPPEAVQKAPGMGLKIMRYRAGLIGGTLEIGPADEGGTRVRCRIPGGP